ncbi:MAG: hypothetical protein GY794_18065 [bacterium]|nr:hypothetical protein [bacterium]
MKARHLESSTNSNTNLEFFGFRFGMSGAHSSRTMMLSEMEMLLASTPGDASKADYAEQAVNFNVLEKKTVKARQLTLRHLAELYSLNENVPLYRVFRQLWASDTDAHPVLALTLSLVRDPILHLSKDFVLSLPLGATIDRTDTEAKLRELTSDRFSPASIKSYAQNINGTWTKAGYFKGRIKKARQRPTTTPTNLAFSLFVAYLQGASGERLFSSSWTRLLDQPEDRLFELAQIASQRGLIVYHRTGGVTEVRFPDYLTPEEREMLPHE